MNRDRYLKALGRCLAVWLSLVLVVGVGSAATWTVSTNKDDGRGSLRWLIAQANSNPGPDAIAFRPGLKGAVIVPRQGLPALSDDGTTIDGDVDDDGRPDIKIQGKLAGQTSGLRVEGDACTIEGLAVMGFQGNGIELIGCSGCVIRCCHVGVNLAGTRAVPNAGSQVFLDNADGNTIGGPTPTGRNVLGATEEVTSEAIVLVRDSDANQIGNNIIGLARDGKTLLAGRFDAGIGIRVAGYTYSSDDNVIGGTDAGHRNVIGGVSTAIVLYKAYRTKVQGNYIGLGGDGDTPAPVWTGIHFAWAARDSLVGGHAAAARNVFGSAGTGILFWGGAGDDTIEGNLFGLNADGTVAQDLEDGIVLDWWSGPASIVRNAFSSSVWSGVRIRESTAEGSTVEGNTFGLLPRGPGSGWGYGVSIYRPGTVRNNTFYGLYRGLLSAPDEGRVVIAGNRFRKCETAVEVASVGRTVLGEVDNHSTQDDGGNTFCATDTWYIRNQTSNNVPAEGNIFPAAPPVHQRVWDKRDDSALGWVDIQPVGSPRLPTNQDLTLAVTGLTAVPERGRAEITFTLSASACVSARVLNVAGRAVRTIDQGRDCPAGMNRLLWDGQSDRGLPLPDGAYVVEVTAKSPGGAQVKALTRVLLHR